MTSRYQLEKMLQLNRTHGKYFSPTYAEAAGAPGQVPQLGVRQRQRPCLGTAAAPYTPVPAPTNASRTRSRLVRTCTAFQVAQGTPAGLCSPPPGTGHSPGAATGLCHIAGGAGQPLPVPGSARPGWVLISHGIP